MSGFGLEAPAMLAGILVVPLLMLLWARAALRGRRDVRKLWRRGGGATPALQATLLMLAAAAAVVAAAGPTWGTRDVPVIRTGADVIFILDISRSMDAGDVAPTRLAAARAAMETTLERTGGDRVGLVVFAGTAHLRFPLSTDPAAAAAVVRSIASGASVVEGGSHLAAALDLARVSFDDDSEAGRLAVLISDGEHRGAAPVPAAERLQAAGVSLLVVGVGTAEGATIPVPETADGPAVLQDDNGNPIVTRLNETLLQDIARAGQGRYLGNSLDALPGAVASRLAALDAAEIARAPAEVPVQRFGIFVAAALAALGLAAIADLIAMLFSLRTARRAAAILAGALALAGLAGCAERSYELNEEGLKAYAAGDLDRALESFEEAAREDPGDMEIVLNIALALHRDGRYRDAALTAERAARSTDRDIRLRALIALANHRYSDGDAFRALDALQQALLLDPESRVARHDFEVILRTLAPPPTEPPPDDSQTPAPGATPSPPPPSPTPGGGPTQPAPGDPEATPEPGATQVPGRGAGRQELEQAMAAIDEAIQSVLGDGDELTYEEALEVLELVAERNRLAELLETAPGARDPESR